MIGPHSTDIANRLDQEILKLRRALTDQRPLGEPTGKDTGRHRPR